MTSTFDKQRAAVPRPTCSQTGKVGYRKKRQAKRDADRLARNANPKRRPFLRPYLCVHCQRWHLTSHAEFPDYMRQRPAPLAEP
jgi:hypothetical protein